MALERDLSTEAIARRFAAGGCCGVRPQITADDLKALGLHPLPATFQSSVGVIAPMSGWKALCLYTLEKLSSEPFPAEAFKHKEGVEPRDVGKYVADFLTKNLAVK